MAERAEANFDAVTKDNPSIFHSVLRNMMTNDSFNLAHGLMTEPGAAAHSVLAAAFDSPSPPRIEA